MYGLLQNRKEIFKQTCGHLSGGTILKDYLASSVVDLKLRAHLGVREERELLDALGCDFFYLPSRDLSQNEGYTQTYKKVGELRIDSNTRTCPLGITFNRGAMYSKFDVDETLVSPLAGAETVKEILDYPLPKRGDFDFEPLLSAAKENSDRITVGGFWSGIMGDSYRLIGFEKFLMYSLCEPEMIKALVDRITDMYLELNDKLFSELKGALDIWFFGNDFGSQNGLLMNIDSWQYLFFDNIKRLAALAKSYGIRVMMHSCGAISPLIPYLIEAGVDIIDPVQVAAKGMSPEELSEEFGGKIIFHGGIDTQRLLVSGTPEEVRLASAKTSAIFSAKGGYIFAPSQILGKDIPVANILAMYGKA